MTSERGFYGWKLVFILWLVDFLNMGFPLYGGAVINTYMLKEIPMSRSEFGLGFTLLTLFVGIPSILVGASIVRLGIRKTFAIGSALILVGALWLSLIASRPWHYWMGFGVLTATGISFGTIVPAATAITRWFSRYRGRTMAVTLSASDRKSTRLNSSHGYISYAVFCLKKKNNATHSTMYRLSRVSTRTRTG